MTQFGPCEPWTPIMCMNWPTGSEAVTGYAIESATFALWSASAGMYGLCTRTIRPCRRDCNDAFGSWWQWTPSGAWPVQPMLYRGNWYNVVCGSCGDSCSCTGIQETILPGPVASVVAVRLDGVTLAATGVYRLDNFDRLTRIDGGVWPTCQDMNAADTEVNTWAVDVQFGIPVPVLGQQAVGELAVEIAKACLGQECRLPQNATQIVRQGITLTIENPNDFVERLYFCGLFINAVNPNRQTDQPVVYDLDGPSPRWPG